ncbi:RNase H family protein [Bacteroidota bacterium]
MQINPYAIYVFCDGAMDYDSKNSGGVGCEIIFPDSVELEDVEISIGRYERGNIERIEIEAIIQGMNELIKIFELHKEALQNVNTIIITTDRYGLNDNDKTSAYRIRDWRKNGWHNHEGKAIKNSDLLERVDKTRKKLSDKTFCSVRIEYQPRKFNKGADRLAKKGKKKALKTDSIALEGIKIGRRKFEGDEIDYKKLKEKEELTVRVFKKEPVRDQWEINVEVCEGDFSGKKLKVYSDNKLEKKLQRHHIYLLRIKKVYTHHIIIFRTIKEIKSDKK